MKTNIHTNQNKYLKPFLRWAGGKQNLVKHLLQFVPKDYNEHTYIEPFLGAGSLFLALKPNKAIISDLNLHLINCYKAIHKNPQRVYKYLRIHIKNNSERYYYRVRDIFNEHIGSASLAQAARFIYLNKTCFNGIFRVNENGFFNVPYGRKNNPSIPSWSELSIISKRLKKAKIYNISYEKIIPVIKKGDFIYLDPPYPSINTRPNFKHYTKERFNDTDQKRLWKFAEQLRNMDCKILISNADTVNIRQYYHEWDIKTIRVVRYITCKKKKYKLNELIITNYNQ